jgi:hypothetical protein
MPKQKTTIPKWDFVGIQTELLRSQMKGVNFKKLDDLSGEELKEFLSGAHLLQNNKILMRIIDDLIARQTEFTVNEALNMEQVIFGRATINGLSLLKEAIEKYNAIYLEQTKKEETFDESEVI